MHHAMILLCEADDSVKNASNIFNNYSELRNKVNVALLDLSDACIKQDGTAT